MRWTLSIVLCVISLPVLASAWVNVTVSTPANNSTLTSPVLIAASATSDRNITGWRIYVDGTSVYHTGSTKTIRTSVTMASGTHQVIIRAWASNGTNGSVTLTETVGSSTPGTAQGTVTPTSLAFGSVATNTSSSPQAVKITNTGSATLNISGVSISPSQFAVSGPTSTSIAPGSSASYSVTFSPTAVSAYSGTMSFSTNSATAVPPVTLSGTGVNRLRLRLRLHLRPQPHRRPRQERIARERHITCRIPETIATTASRRVHLGRPLHMSWRSNQVSGQATASCSNGEASGRNN